MQIKLNNKYHKNYDLYTYKYAKKAAIRYK